MSQPTKYCEKCDTRYTIPPNLKVRSRYCPVCLRRIKRK